MNMAARQLDLFVPAAPPDPTHGLRVRLLGHCPHCGERIAVIGARSGPHAAALFCARCDRFRQWLSHDAQAFIAEAIKHFGIPTEPIVVHIATKNFHLAAGAGEQEATQARRSGESKWI